MSAGALVWEATPPSRRIRPRMAPASVGEMKRPGEPIGEDEGTATAAESIPAGAAADPDVALMLRLQAGDQAAFQDLFQKFSPRVVQYARRLVGSEARAEEVTQDVFVQVFRFRHRYRPESRFSTWLFTIATNLCLNEIWRPELRPRAARWKPSGDGDDRREGPPISDPASPNAEPCPSARSRGGGARAREPLGALAAAAGVRPRHGRGARARDRHRAAHGPGPERARGPGAQGRCQGSGSGAAIAAAPAAPLRGGAPRGAARQARRGAGPVRGHAHHPQPGQDDALRGDPDHHARRRARHPGRAGAALERMRRGAAIAVVLLALAAPAARAQERHGRPWQELTPEEQWRAWENYQRYQQLPEERQKMLERRYQQFRAMPPQERQRLRQNWDTYRGLPPRQRQEFIDKYHRWKGRK